MQNNLTTKSMNSGKFQSPELELIFCMLIKHIIITTAKQFFDFFSKLLNVVFEA
jgi:hypothetical protein